MSGSRAKQSRKRFGISIQARRDQAAFTRVMARAIVERTEKHYQRRRQLRQAAAWAGLVAVAALIAWGLFG